MQRDWRKYIAKGAAQVHFEERTATLRSEHQKLVHNLVPPAREGGRWCGRKVGCRQRRADGPGGCGPGLPVPLIGEDVAAELPDVVETSLRRLLDPTLLPTHADVIDVVPWLDPAYEAPPLPDSVWRQRLSDVATPVDYITPLAWLYLMTNPYNKVGHDVLATAAPARGLTGRVPSRSGAGTGQVCELLTREYVDALASYLAARIDAYGPGPGSYG